MADHARARVVYHPEPHGAHDRDYLLDLAARSELGELFLETEHPLSPGTVLTLEVQATSKDGSFAPLRGRAIVSSRRRWRKPYGMHVVLYEIEEMSQPPFAAQVILPWAHPLPSFT